MFPTYFIFGMSGFLQWINEEKNETRLKVTSTFQILLLEFHTEPPFLERENKN